MIVLATGSIRNGDPMLARSPAVAVEGHADMNRVAIAMRRMRYSLLQKSVK
jgi:hypothetical protein